jgi:hypothetical protein
MGIHQSRSRPGSTRLGRSRPRSRPRRPASRRRAGRSSAWPRTHACPSAPIRVHRSKHRGTAPAAGRSYRRCRWMRPPRPTPAISAREPSPCRSRARPSGTSALMPRPSTTRTQRRERRGRRCARRPNPRRQSGSTGTRPAAASPRCRDAAATPVRSHCYDRSRSPPAASRQHRRVPRSRAQSRARRRSTAEPSALSSPHHRASHLPRCHVEARMPVPTVLRSTGPH